MKVFNKFEVAAELNTEEKRDEYLLKITFLDLNIKDMTEYIDAINLATECHPKKLLLSKEWQKGFECNRLRMKKSINTILENLLTDANTTLDAAVKLSIGGDIVDELSNHSFISENDRESLLNKLVKNANKYQAEAFCMYDPEIHPDLGEEIENGKEQLFFWTDKYMAKLLKK